MPDKKPPKPKNWFQKIQKRQILPPSHSEKQEAKERKAKTASRKQSTSGVRG